MLTFLLVLGGISVGMAATLRSISNQSAERLLNTVRSEQSKLASQLTAYVSHPSALRTSLRFAPTDSSLAKCLDPSSANPAPCINGEWYDFSLYAPDATESFSGTSSSPVFYSLYGERCGPLSVGTPDCPMRVVTRFTPICDADGVATNCAEKFVDLSEGKPRYTVGAVFFQVEFEIEQARDLSGKVIALGRYNAVPGSLGVFEGVGQLRPVSGKSRVLHRCDVTSCPRPPELAFVPGGPSFDFGTVVAPNRPFVDMTLMNIGEAELGELPTGLECWLDGAGAARFSIDAANSSCLTPARTLAGGASCTVRVYFEGDDLPEPAGPTPYTSRLHCRGQNNFPPLVETAIGHDMMGIWEPAATATPSPTPTPTPTPTSTPAPTSTPTPTPAPTALPTPTPTPLAEAVLLLSAPDPVDFGVQTSQTERVVTLSNIGKSAITSPISVTFDGGGAGGLSLGGTSTCIHGVTVLTAGQSCTFVVVFNPVGLPAGQAVFGSLSVSANKTSSALTGDSSAILATAGPLPSGKLLVEVSGGTTVSSGVISGASAPKRSTSPTIPSQESTP